jgi:hypothetical protein
MTLLKTSPHFPTLSYTFPSVFIHAILTLSHRYYVDFIHLRDCDNADNDVVLPRQWPDRPSIAARLSVLQWPWTNF